MVEVGGALGPSFEAQAVNLSEEGMSLRTAYLPEVGQPITCRFDAGQGAEVVAAGEVLWKEDHGDGGEFGIRFTNLDGQSAAALQRILGSTSDGQMLRAPSGRKIRLHIEGLASPMRARVRDEAGPSVTAYSELGFLQLGKPLELEDAASAMRRPALIDRVEVDVDQGSRVPQLVVTLRYDDEEARAQAASLNPVVVDESAQENEGDEGHTTDRDHPAEHAPAAEAKAAPSEEAEEPKMKSAFARTAEKARVDATIAFEKMAKKAKTTIAMIAAKVKKTDDGEAPVRRMTAPPPGGALHAAGRKVIRSSVADEQEIKEPAAKPRIKVTKKKIAVAGAVSAALVLAIIATRKPASAPQAASAPPADSAIAAVAAHPTSTAPAAAPTGAAPGTTPNDPLTATAMNGSAFNDPLLKHGKPVPFTNGPVGHGNVLKLKMDGPIPAIQGAASPTGFTVTIPGRKSLDSAAPLASKDARIGAIKVSNETGGAELTVTFKDGVPNYLVKAKGDVLEVHLAKPTHEASASKKKRKH
jgi:hypothetical protein